MEADRRSSGSLSRDREERRSFDVLDRAFGRACGTLKRLDGPVRLLFSGGVDSGLLAWEWREQPQLGLVTVAAHGGPDLEAARSAASRLRAPWAGFEVEEGEVGRMADDVAGEFGPLQRTSRDVLVALGLALARCGPGRVLCGQGADELFLGYAHFRGLDALEAERRAGRDLATLREVEWPRARRLAETMGVSLSAPYLAADFVTAALGIPIEERTPRARPKGLFRDWAMHRGLPAEIAERPKRALQFGSGVARVLRRRTPHAGPVRSA